jgi:hypothetical protein
MPKTCGAYAVKYGQQIEILDGEGNILASFKARSDMCKEILDRYLSNMYSVDTTKTYKIKRVR